MIKHLCLATLIAASLAGTADAAKPAPPPPPQVGMTLPDNFPVIENFYLGKPIIGFGSDVGHVSHVPVIFMHGNNDSPFPTACNPFGYIHNLAQFFLDNGYRPSELWGIGYQGDQCDLQVDETHRSSVAHTTAVAVPLLPDSFELSDIASDVNDPFNLCFARYYNIHGPIVPKKS